jgi:hypothetical protein
MGETPPEWRLNKSSVFYHTNIPINTKSSKKGFLQNSFLFLPFFPDMIRIWPVAIRAAIWEGTIWYAERRTLQLTGFL